MYSDTNIDIYFFIGLDSDIDSIKCAGYISDINTYYIFTLDLQFLLCGFEYRRILVIRIRIQAVPFKT